MTVLRLNLLDHIMMTVISADTLAFLVETEQLFLAENQSQLDRLFKIMVDLLDKYNKHNATSFKIEPL